MGFVILVFFLSLWTCVLASFCPVGFCSSGLLRMVSVNAAISKEKMKCVLSFFLNVYAQLSSGTRSFFLSDLFSTSICMHVLG